MGDGGKGKGGKGFNIWAGAGAGKSSKGDGKGKGKSGGKGQQWPCLSCGTPCYPNTKTCRRCQRQNLQYQYLRLERCQVDNLEAVMTMVMAG